jgi:hypothetical protein
MFKIRGIDKPSPQPGVDVSQPVPLYCDVANHTVECERLLAEEEDATPRIEVIAQPGGAAYTSNPML